MKDKKYTDEEIIKALECCAKSKTNGDCVTLNCPCFKDGMCIFVDDDLGLQNYDLDLINRQKAEIENLEKQMDWLTGYNKNLMDANTALSEEILETKAEAYKEFAERIKEEIENAYNNNSNVVCEHMSKHTECPDYEFIATVRGKMNTLRGLDDFIDNLLKEMVGEEE